MNSKLNVTWNDLVSPTMKPGDYLEIYRKKIESNYKTYKPKSDILEKIKTQLKKNDKKLKIVALGADWCPDCNKNVPRMIKIVEQLNSKNVEFRILYGIMVNALHKPGETIWHEKRSPPEAVDPRFELKAIPTFYFFNKNDEFIGMIKENPKETIEEDMFEILITS